MILDTRFSVKDAKTPDLSQKTVCFVDNGLFTGFARTVGKAFKKAYYYVPWQSAFVRSRTLTVGIGFPELVRTRDVLKLVDEVDLWVFLDQFHTDLQWLLVNKFGARVWGARDGEELELYRWETRQVLKRLGLPTLDAEHIIGFDNLDARLRQIKGEWWVKNSFNNGGRADMETWKFKSYEGAQERLAELRYDLGALREVYEFLLEADYPKAVEIGYDGDTVDGQWPDHAMQAFEIKGLGMFGTIKPYARLAEPVRMVNEKLAPVLKGYGYRGFLSTEIRWGKERKPYLIDPCCRLGSPSNELLQKLIGNWPEKLWAGAEGRVIPVKVVAPFGCVAMVYSEQSGKNWENLKYPKEIDEWVILRNPTVIKSKRFAVPQGQPQNVAGVVGIGRTMLEAAKAMGEHAKQVEGDRITIDVQAIEKAVEVIQEGEKYGIRFSDGPTPKAEELRRAVG